MKRLIAPIVIGTLTLAAALPAAAQQKPASDNGASVGMASSRDPGTERTSFTKQAQEEMHLWEKRLHDFNARIEDRTTQRKANASKDLDRAWSETKTAWNQLETAGENNWNSAKASFEDASHKLGATWQRVSSKDK